LIQKYQNIKAVSKLAKFHDVSLKSSKLAGAQTVELFLTASLHEIFNAICSRPILKNNSNNFKLLTATGTW
jgi:hypothetical protein